MHREDAVTKTHDGGIKDRKSDRKEVWVYPHVIPKRCTVRLVDKYLKPCLMFFKKENSYLQCKQNQHPLSGMLNRS